MNENALIYFLMRSKDHSSAAQRFNMLNMLLANGLAKLWICVPLLAASVCSVTNLSTQWYYGAFLIVFNQINGMTE